MSTPPTRHARLRAFSTFHPACQHDPGFEGKNTSWSQPAGAHAERLKGPSASAGPRRSRGDLEEIQRRSRGDPEEILAALGSIRKCHTDLALDETVSSSQVTAGFTASFTAGFTAGHTSTRGQSCGVVCSRVVVACRTDGVVAGQWRDRGGDGVAMAWR